MQLDKFEVVILFKFYYAKMISSIVKKINFLWLESTAFIELL